MVDTRLTRCLHQQCLARRPRPNKAVRRCLRDPIDIRFNLLLANGAAALRLLEPLGYLDFLALVADAVGVLTDSGGIQEDTTFLGWGMSRSPWNLVAASG
jgi:hypothetical protein